MYWLLFPIFINIKFHLPLFWPTDWDVKIGLYLLYQWFSYGRQILISYRWGFHWYQWHKLEKEYGQVLSRWHTAYSVSPVKLYTFYDNPLISFWKPVFKPLKNSPCYVWHVTNFFSNSLWETVKHFLKVKINDIYCFCLVIKFAYIVIKIKQTH